jgi:hypothetical protein
LAAIRERAINGHGSGSNPRDADLPSADLAVG